MNNKKGLEAVVVAVEVVELSSSNRVEATKAVVVVEVGLLSSTRQVEAKDVEVMEVAVEISVAEWLLSSTMVVHLNRCISRAGEHPNNSSVMEGLLSTIRCKAGERSNNSSTLNTSSNTLNSTNKPEDHHHKAEVVAKKGLYPLLVDLLGHLAPTYTKLSRLHDKQR